MHVTFFSSYHNTSADFHQQFSSYHLFSNLLYVTMATKEYKFLYQPKPIYCNYHKIAIVHYSGFLSNISVNS